MEHYKRTDLRDATDGLRSAFIALLGFSACVNLLMLAAPLYMLQVFDRVLLSRSIDTLVLLTLMVAVAFIAMGILEALRGMMLARIGEWFEQQLATKLLQHSVIERLARGRTNTAQSLRDLGTVRGYLGGSSMLPLMDAPWTPVFLGIIFLLHPVLGWTATAGALVLMLLAIANEIGTRKLLQKSSSDQIRAMDQAEAAVRNADVIEAMGMFPALAARWNRQRQSSVEQQARASQRSTVISSTSKFVRLLLQSGMLGIGAWLVINQELTPGGMVAGTILLGRALAPVDQALGSWKGLVNARTAYRRLREGLEAAPELTDSMPLPRPQGLVRCEGVTYRHGETGEPTLRDISFELPPGKVLGVIGPSAAGKTTLARLLVGNLRPRLGNVRLDGMDISKWASDDRGQYVGYLPQDIELFNATVAENIARLQTVDSDSVIDAAMLAGVHEMILQLPEGYETVIGDGGAALSAGQRQRIGLARALYGNPSLIVLDEPNSNLDHAGLSALLGALDAMRKRDATLIVITHQSNVIRHLDALLVLEAGSIRLSGPRDAVLERMTRPVSEDAVAAAPEVQREIA